jgi:hypothetical protein
MIRTLCERSVVWSYRGVDIEEVVMATTVATTRRSTFGIYCVECRDALIAPEKSEYRHGTHIRHQWYCPNCATSFESLESIPVEAMTTDDIFPLWRNGSGSRRP